MVNILDVAECFVVNSVRKEEEGRLINEQDTILRLFEKNYEPTDNFSGNSDF
jgi:hypothetical protein